MKQSNYIPRRVGTSLLRSLSFYANAIIGVGKEANSEHNGHDERADHPRHTNKKLITQRDLDTCESIQKFYEKMTQMMDKNQVPSGGFVTIAKLNKDKTKYVATPTSFGLVTTTATLTRILNLVTALAQSEHYPDKKGAVRTPIMIVEQQYEGYHGDYSPHFLRIADVIRYLNESEADVLEMNLDGIEHDFLFNKSFYQNNSYYRSSHDEQSALHASKMCPMISDRYQDESWKHYLTTLYSGMVEPNKFCPTASTMPKSIAVTELKALEQV